MQQELPTVLSDIYQHLRDMNNIRLEMMRLHKSTRETILESQQLITKADEILSQY